MTEKIGDTVMKIFRKAEEKGLAAEEEETYCGSCDQGWIIEDGRAVPCGCVSGMKTRKRQAWMDGILARHRCGMGRRLAKSNQNTFITRPGQEHVRITLDKYVDDLAEGKTYGFLIIGNPGVGKSYAAAYVVNTVKARAIMTAAFANFSRLLTGLRSTFRAVDEHKGLISILYDSDLLVVDDLGMEQKVSDDPATSWSVSEFYKVIDYRFDEEKPTIITTNRTEEELEERFGAPIVSRIKGLTTTLDLAGSDNRRGRKTGGKR